MSVEDKIYRKTEKTLNFPLPNLSRKKNINHDRVGIIKIRVKILFFWISRISKVYLSMHYFFIHPGWLPT